MLSQIIAGARTEVRKFLRVWVLMHDGWDAAEKWRDQ